MDYVITENNLSHFDMNLCLRPVWQGGLVWQESLVFTEPEEGSLSSAKLVLLPKKIITLRSADLKTEYEEGRDYTVDGKTVKLMRDSRITPLLKATYTQTKETCTDGWPTVYENVFWRPLGFAAVADHTVYVTYETDEKWEGPVPEDVSSRLPRMFDKLKNKEKLSFLWYGDSQMYGADSSGPNGFEPFYPPYAKMVTDAMSEKYGTEIEYINTSAGGTASAWGLENVEERVCKYSPDVLFMKFGGNEVWMPADEFGEITKKIILKVAEACPDTEIVLPTMFIHNEQAGAYITERIDLYEDAYRKLQRELAPGIHIAIIPVYPSSKFLSDSKGYFSITANILNHVNDFGCRVNAQLILQGLGYYD